MVSGSRIDAGTQNLPAHVRKTIQSIKEIVGNHSEADIYSVLKETYMDPNETAQKLLNQDPFHEVKRKRDKKKELQNLGNTGFAEPRKPIEYQGKVTKPQPQASRDRNTQRGGYRRNTSRGISREFRIVRDNRVNQNGNGDAKPESPQYSTSSKEQVASSVPGISFSGIRTDQKNLDATNSEQLLSSQRPNDSNDMVSSHPIDADLNSIRRHALPGEKRPISNLTQGIPGQKPHNSSTSSMMLASNNSVVGVYSKTMDPVHVPSPDLRSSGMIGAIKRDVGVVGLRRQSFQNSGTHLSGKNSSISSSLLAKDSSASTESLGQSSASLNKSDELSQVPVSQAVISGLSVSRSFMGTQQSSKPRQQPVGHQKVSQANMAWKPKPSQKSSVTSNEVINKPPLAISYPAEGSIGASMGGPSLPEKLVQVNVSESQHVIIPNHLRIAEADRSRFTFGSFGARLETATGFNSTLETFVDDAEESKDEPAVSISSSSPVASTIRDVSGGDEIDLLEDQVRASRSQSPTSAEAFERPQTETKESSSPRDLDNYQNIGLVRNQSAPYSLADTQQQADSPADLPSFPGYDSQNGYDVTFFRPTMDENEHGQGLASPHEALNTHATDNGHPSTVPMVQQQQPVAQLYPPVHISHFPNFMPYRQILSPVYVPPMAVPNYPNNLPYPHPSSGNSYVLMPRGSSHLATGKYAPLQYKPVPATGPTGYGNYTNSAGFTINTMGSVGGPTGMEDVSRIKYKDGNLFVPNQQAETSEIWIQTPRELPGMQSAPYYNISGQAPHAAYVPSHASPSSFNTLAQPSHVPFPGLYHPSQQNTIPSAHHHVVQQQLPGVTGNIGVAGPGAQVGAYQQPQHGHLNWTPNF